MITSHFFPSANVNEFSRRVKSESFGLFLNLIFTFAVNIKLVIKSSFVNSFFVKICGLEISPLNFG